MLFSVNIQVLLAKVLSSTDSRHRSLAQGNRSARGSPQGHGAPPGPSTVYTVFFGMNGMSRFPYLSQLLENVHMYTLMIPAKSGPEIISLPRKQSEVIKEWATPKTWSMEGTPIPHNVQSLLCVVYAAVRRPPASTADI